MKVSRIHKALNILNFCMKIDLFWNCERTNTFLLLIFPHEIWFLKDTIVYISIQVMRLFFLY